MNPWKGPVRCHADSDSIFCNYGDPKAPKIPGAELMPTAVGICYQNKPDCGVVGKTCCVQEGMWSRGYRCEDGTCVNQPGKAHSPYKLCVARN